jgi:flagellar biosynthesis/type III secretory pathway protein FliH
LSDEQVRTATAALEKSTAAIEEHARTLREQQNALKEFQAKNHNEAVARGKAADGQIKGYVAKRQRLAQDVSLRCCSEDHFSYLTA